MKKFNFDLSVKQRRGQIIARAYEAFQKITSLPNDIRGDEKQRTGIKVLIKELGTGNLVLFSVLNPPEISEHFVNEKLTRMEICGDFSSQNSEDIEIFRFRGAIVFKMSDGSLLAISVSGLLPDEDVAVAIDLMCISTGVLPYRVIENIKNNKGLLPDWINWKNDQQNHYLYNFANPH